MLNGDFLTLIAKTLEIMQTVNASVGMIAEITESKSKEKCKTEVLDVLENKILLKRSVKLDTFVVAKTTCDISVVVKNVLYLWNGVTMTETETGGIKCYQIQVEESPRVINRRKHPRLPLKNECEIFVNSLNRSFRGKMVNISAGGYAFACKDEAFANAVEERVEQPGHSASWEWWILWQREITQN